MFTDPYKLRVLGSIVHPEIKRMMLETISEVQYRYSDLYDVIAIEGAVIVEGKTYNMLDELWVTTLDKEQAVPRLLKRNPNLTLQQAKDRVYA